MLLVRLLVVVASCAPTSAAFAPIVQIAPSIGGPISSAASSVAGGGGTSFLVGGNDDCSAPAVLFGLGTFAIDTTGSTTGTEGQSEAACLFAGSTAITNDTWFRWAAPFNGTARISLCNSGAVDFKLAVYAGTACPSGPALACSDDQCYVQPSVCFEVAHASFYLIQIGSPPGASAGPGSLVIAQQAVASGCQLDDGTAEVAAGFANWNPLGETMWLQSFGEVGQTTVIYSISTAWGAPAFAAGCPPAGTPVRVAVLSDGGNDGIPNSGSMLQQVAGVLANPATNQLQTFTLATPQTVTGKYFLAVIASSGSYSEAAPIDQTSCTSGSSNRSWMKWEESGCSFSDTSFVVPLSSFAAQGGVFLLRGDCTVVGGVPYCGGGDMVCPCANGGLQGHGCENSFSTGGALLTISGNPSVSLDTVQLQGSHFPPTTSCLFFQGTSQAASVFGDGIRCVAGSVLRLGIRNTSAGLCDFGFGILGDPLVHVAGAIPPEGGLRHYSVWYRNSAPYCTPAGFNLTNGFTLNWQI